MRRRLVLLLMLVVAAPLAAQDGPMVQLGTRVRVMHDCQSRLGRNGAVFETCRYQAGTLRAVTAVGVVLDPADAHEAPIELSFDRTRRVEVSRGQLRATFAKWGVLGMLGGLAGGWMLGVVTEFTVCGLDCDGTITAVGTVLGGAGGLLAGVRSGRSAREGWVRVPLRQVRRLHAPDGPVFPLRFRVP